MVHAFKTTRIHYPGHRKNGPLAPETVRAVREKGQGRALVLFHPTREPIINHRWVGIVWSGTED